MSVIQAVTEQELIDFLTEARLAGYPSGRQPDIGIFPSSSTTPPYFSADKKLSVQDTWFGHRQAGGFELVCTEQSWRRGILLVQYGGKCRDDVSLEEVDSIGNFLKRALRSLRVARLPMDTGHYLTYTEEHSPYAYYGVWHGGIFNLEGVEIIVRKGTPPKPNWVELFELFHGSDVVLNISNLVDLLFETHEDMKEEDVIFYHTVTNSRIG